MSYRTGFVISQSFGWFLSQWDIFRRFQPTVHFSRLLLYNTPCLFYKGVMLLKVKCEIPWEFFPLSFWCNSSRLFTESLTFTELPPLICALINSSLDRHWRRGENHIGERFRILDPSCTKSSTGLILRQNISFLYVLS